MSGAGPSSSLSQSPWPLVIAAIERANGRGFAPTQLTRVGGGCINQCYRLSDGHQSWFVKLNRHQCLSLFEAEADGLAALGDWSLPPLTLGQAGEHAFLVLPFVALTSHGNHFEAGRAIARLHQADPHHLDPQGYGWHRHNFIGETVQYNHWQGCWARFWWQCRLQPQLTLARQRGFGKALAPAVAGLESISDRVLAEHQPQACLVHGDLWQGNLGFVDGQARVFDPACYLGDRETDLAMTELFGGFDPEFYRGYESQWPLSPGYQRRRPLYQLYHLLNHLNLFGDGYLDSVRAKLQQL
ncbi:fructosamine kinase family protein [Ferrimonas sp. SCSIO 43195]|uniref:fructosamine kinase family protein n=1 Tax=Ferrimonas sp. SCSIO 43195 TaxID=2822844 RepID=UPI002075B3D9|nr:fructosamine kinase family protein [Ferrimonas sp. SCSIO 43195]USD39523.1 fructosamine kinase family protein [Ferrimonas sp. SCSIO 43195]